MQKSKLAIAGSKLFMHKQAKEPMPLVLQEDIVDEDNAREYIQQLYASKEKAPLSAEEEDRTENSRYWLLYGTD